MDLIFTRMLRGNKSSILNIKSSINNRFVVINKRNISTLSNPKNTIVRRFYSSHSLLGVKNISQFKPVKVYTDLIANKSLIVKENKNLSGVYIFYNNDKGKIYIGSSKDLGKRLYSYLIKSYLLRQRTSIICKSLLKKKWSL